MAKKNKDVTVTKVTFTITNNAGSDQHRIDMECDRDTNPFELVQYVIDGAMLISEYTSDPEFARRLAAQRLMEHINAKKDENKGPNTFRFPITNVAEA